MEKLNLNYNNLDFQEILSFIKNSSLGKQIIQDLNLTDKEIIDHYELINNYIKINKRCEKNTTGHMILGRVYPMIPNATLDLAGH